MALSDNLFDYWPLTSNTLVGAVNGNVLTAVNMEFEAASPGPCWRRNSPTSGYLISATKNLVTPFTMAIEAYLVSSGETAILYYMRGEGNDKHQGLFRTGLNKAGSRTRYGTVVDVVSADDFQGNAAWGKIAGVWTSATSRALYHIDTLGAADTTNLALGDLNLFQKIVVGAMYDGSTTWLGSPENCRFRNLAVWERALSDTELDSYYADPGQLVSGSGGKFLRSSPLLTSRVLGSALLG